MHIGNLRTALFAYLIAKQQGGDFILRIEDTDQGRYVEGATEVIYKTLKDVGLNWDEGPDIGGPVGPYIQSERMGMFKKYAEELVEKGEAYYCFCDKERLDGLKAECEAQGKTYSYDRHCRGLSKEEVQAKLSAGTPYVIRQKMPLEGSVTFHDELYGDITVDCTELEDQILIKTDGMPTYNFANVVDDHLMGITHVVRGNEYISSTPKYNRLYEAFGWEIPKYIHCPLITDEDHHKLSKRSGHSSFEDLLEQGFLVESVVNFIALLGWSPEDNEEILSLDELIEKFDYHRINKSPSVFDYTKLKWMNGEYLKRMDDDKFYELALPYMKEVITKDVDFHKIAAMIKTRIEIWPDIAGMVDFFEKVPEYDNAIYYNKKMKTDAQTSLPVLKELLPLIESIDDYSNDNLFAKIKEFVGEKGYKNGYVLWPLRIALSGKEQTPCGGTEIMEVLGKEESIARIKAAIAKLEA